MQNFIAAEKTAEHVIFIDLYHQNDDGIAESHWEFSNKLGQANFRKFIFNNIHLCFGELKLNEDKFIKIQAPQPVIEMYFSLTGSSSVETNSFNEYVFSSNEHNLLYFPEKEYSVRTLSGKEACSSFHIIFPESYFLQLLQKKYPLLDDFKNDIYKKNSAILTPKNMAITAEMNSILNEIVNCKRKGVLKCLFLEAKILKLLMLQLEQFEIAQSSGKFEHVKDYDVEKIRIAKNILEENISAPISLIELAHKAGINDFKLKKGFKEIYGNTVFGYLNELRMNEAKKLLLASDKSITEISQYCGYRFVQNFTKVFKKKFGVTPKNFKIAQEN